MISGEEANKIRTGLSSMLDMACSHISQVSRAVKRLDNLKIVLYMKRDNAKVAIQDCIKKLQEQLLELQKITETNLNLEVHAREDILRSTKVKLMQHIRDTAGECTIIEELLEAGKEEQLAQKGQTVLQIMEGLVQYNADEAIVGLAHLEFVPNTVNIMAALQNPSLFGYLQCTVVSPSDISLRMSGHEQMPRCLPKGETLVLALESGDTYIVNLTQYFKLMLFQPDRSIEELAVEDLEDGSYRAKFQPKMHGPHVVHVKLYGNPVIGSPISFLVMDSSPAETMVTKMTSAQSSPARVRVCRSTLTAMSKHIGSNPPVRENIFETLENNYQVLENSDIPLQSVTDNKESSKSKLPGGTKRKFHDDVDTRGTSNEEAHTQMNVTRQEFNDNAPEPRASISSFGGPMKDIAQKYDAKGKGNSAYGFGKTNGSSSGVSFSRSDSVDNWRKPNEPTAVPAPGTQGTNRSQASVPRATTDKTSKQQAPSNESNCETGMISPEPQPANQNKPTPLLTKTVSVPEGAHFRQQDTALMTKNRAKSVEFSATKSDSKSQAYRKDLEPFLSEKEFVHSQKSDTNEGNLNASSESSQKISSNCLSSTQSVPSLSTTSTVYDSRMSNESSGFGSSISKSPPPGFLVKTSAHNLPKSSSGFGSRRSAPPGFGSKVTTESTSESSFQSASKPVGASIKHPPPGFGLSTSKSSSSFPEKTSESSANGARRSYMPPPPTEQGDSQKQDKQDKISKPAFGSSGRTSAQVTLHSGQQEEVWNLDDNNNGEPVPRKSQEAPPTQKNSNDRESETASKQELSREQNDAKESEIVINSTKKNKGGGLGSTALKLLENGKDNAKNIKGRGFGSNGTSKDASAVKSTKANSSENENPFEKYLWENKVLKMHMTLKLGKQGMGIKDFSFPIGITVTQQNDLIVCDTGNEVVKVFHCTGTPLFTIGAEKKCFKRPSAVATNKDGIIFIKDDRQIQAFDKKGRFLYAFGQGILSKPYGLALTGEGHLLTLDETRNRRKLCLFSQSGELIREDPFEPATMDKRRSRCRFLAVYKDRLFVVDLGQSEIYITDLQGKSVASFGSFGDKAGQFREPSGISIDVHGNVFIADSKNNRIQYFSQDGECKCVVKLDQEILRPSDIHVTDDGRLIISNLLMHCVKLYTVQKGP